MDAILLAEAVRVIKQAKRTVAFTGAGISVESGVPAFRGENGLFAQYDPACFDINYFDVHPEEAWKAIKTTFYDNFSCAVPNAAHESLAEMERLGYLQGVITQNIDHLHQKAGSKDVTEFHGSSQRLVCRGCGHTMRVEEVILENLPPRCGDCHAFLKPDFVFFGESIPPQAYRRAVSETLAADVWLVIGTTGEVMPASTLPLEAKRNGKTLIEVNIQPSNYTEDVIDIYLEGKATEVLQLLLAELMKN